MGFKIIFALFLIASIAGGLSYITHALTSGAAAKVEARYLAEAAKVQRESARDVEKRSAAAAAEIEGDLEASRSAAAAHRARAAQLEKRLKAVEADAEDPGICRPGCSPAWGDAE